MKLPDGVGVGAGKGEGARSVTGGAAAVDGARGGGEGGAGGGAPVCALSRSRATVVGAAVGASAVRGVALASTGTAARWVLTASRYAPPRR